MHQCCLINQAFLPSVVYPLGTRTTSQLFYLSIANTTIIPLPSGAPRRYEELYAQQYMSYFPPGCLAGNATDPIFLMPGNGCELWTTFAIYDWKWHSQLQVTLSPPSCYDLADFGSPNSSYCLIFISPRILASNLSSLFHLATYPGHPQHCPVRLPYPAVRPGRVLPKP